MAHEIGHNLGMSHDSSGNSCDSNGYIMSPSRGTTGQNFKRLKKLNFICVCFCLIGETAWSSCSRDVVSSLNLDCLTDQEQYN